MKLEARYPGRSTTLIEALFLQTNTSKIKLASYRSALKCNIKLKKNRMKFLTIARNRRGLHLDVRKMRCIFRSNLKKE